MEYQGRKRYLVVLWGFFEILCFGGLELGWGSLIYVLKDEGVYADLCQYEDINTTVIPYTAVENITLMISTSFENLHNFTTESSRHCPEQDLRLNLFYTIGTGCAIFFHLLGGQIFSRYGTRAVRCLYIFFFWCGCTMIAFTSPDLPWLICPGVLFVTGGSLVFLVTTTQFSNMYSKGSILVLGLMNGVMDSSSVIQLLVKLAHTAGFKRKYSYLAIMAFSVTTLISTFTIYPKHYILKTSEKRDKIVNRNNIRDVEEEETEDPTPFKKYTFNRIFIPHILWFGILMLHFNYYIATINAYLNYITEHDKPKVSYFTNILSYTMFCGLVSSSAVGYLYDHQKQKYKKLESTVLRKVRPAIMPMIIATTLMLILSILMMLPYTWTLYIAFIDFTIFRSFLFAVAVSFLADCFPTKVFGILYTVMLTQSSIMHFVEYGLFIWWESYEGAIWHVHIFLLVLSVLAFAHPLALWVNQRRLTIKEGNIGNTTSRYFAVLEEN